MGAPSRSGCTAYRGRRIHLAPGGAVAQPVLVHGHHPRPHPPAQGHPPQRGLVIPPCPGDPPTAGAAPLSICTHAAACPSARRPPRWPPRCLHAARWPPRCPSPACTPGSRATLLASAHIRRAFYSDTARTQHPCGGVGGAWGRTSSSSPTCTSCSGSCASVTPCCAFLRRMRNVTYVDGEHTCHTHRQEVSAADCIDSAWVCVWGGQRPRRPRGAE